jgi:hypothetical protein
LFLLYSTDVPELVLCKSIHKEGTLSAPNEKNRPVPFGLSVSRSCNPLFDNLTAQVSINLAFLGSIYRFLQSCVLQTLFSGKTLKPFGFENPQASLLNFAYSIV